MILLIGVQGTVRVNMMIFNPGTRKSKQIIRDANAARDARDYRRAALLYEKALRLVPDNAAIHIQCGHMFKEAGELASAEPHYLRANQLTPDDPDLALQLGHFHKVAGRPKEAERSYKRAIELDPTWPEPAVQLAELYRNGWRTDAKGQIGNWIIPANSDGFRLDSDSVLPELAPVPPQSKLLAHREEIAIRSLGRRERTRWGGVRNTLRGVDAIRGFCVSAVPIVELRAMINGLRFYTAPLQAFQLKYEKDDLNKRKYIFNIWYDFSAFVDGVYELELQFVDENAGVRIYKEPIVIAPPLSEDDYPSSDRLVSISGSDPHSLEEQINSRPSVIRPAKRRQFATPPRNVLIQRVDQLGDMVVSIPAVRRLREILPSARLVGLLSHANAGLAGTLNLFDEVISVDFPDDEWERRRVMPLEKQRELRRKLEAFKFDIAIDLTESDVTRPLLLLSGAPYLFGFKDDHSPWLSAFYEGYTRDPMNGLQEVPPTVRLAGLVEWFGAIISDHSQVITRDNLERGRLAPYGLSATDRFAVLHTGARLTFSQWPHYDKLASRILDKTDLKVVMMTDDSLRRSKLAPELAASNRFQLLDKRLPFDDFDALLSFCTVFVGNDSGPSHLASLRGANVINLYLNRHNWNEWGHENNGYIISRRVPCAGCNVHHDPEECGKGFACITNISPEEVFRTVTEFV
jgi:ADP-heptose:LPS heptosyltransferase/tetratricopeptide (TPR) repeat protein